MNHDNPAELLARLMMEADPADREVLATVFGAADVIARHLPAHALSRAVQACWLTSVAVEAAEANDPHAAVLWRVARVVLDDATMPMLPLIARAPDDAAGLT